jgi:hypothetical protein
MRRGRPGSGRSGPFALEILGGGADPLLDSFLGNLQAGGKPFNALAPLEPAVEIQSERLVHGIPHSDFSDALLEAKLHALVKFSK